ncbi:MAG: hypothetical protein ACI4EC_00155 [Lachnospiraceae bacterium]
MCDFNDLQINSQQQQNIQEQRRAEELEERRALRNHLAQLQEWDVADGQSIEQRRMQETDLVLNRQKTINEQLMQNVARRHPPVKAKKTAKGTPVQKQKPAKKTFKQKREDKRLDEQAKEITPIADHISIHMYEALRRNQILEDNSENLLTKEQKKEAAVNGIDMRVLRTYAYGYRMNKKGQPASRQDEAHKEADLKFLNDYASKDLERRRPHLDRILEQVLNIRLTMDMLTPEYMEDHMVEVYKQVCQMVYFQNIYNDSVNKKYFDELPQLTKDLIEHRVLARYGLMGLVMSAVCTQKGVDSNHICYNKDITRQSDLEMTNESLRGATQGLRAVIRDCEEQEQISIQNGLHQEMQTEQEKLMGEAQKVKEQAETMGGDTAGLGLTSYVTNASLAYLAKYRKMIEDHQDMFARQVGMVNPLYQSMHHTMEVKGDLTLQIMSVQAVIKKMESPEEQRKETSRLVLQAAKTKLDQLSEELDLVEKHLNAHEEAFECIFSHKALRGPARLLMDQLRQQQ